MTYVYTQESCLTARDLTMVSSCSACRYFMVGCGALGCEPQAQPAQEENKNKLNTQSQKTKNVQNSSIARKIRSINSNKTQAWTKWL